MNYLKAKQAILALSAIGISASSITSCNKEKANVVAPEGNVNGKVIAQVDNLPELSDASLQNYIYSIVYDNAELTLLKNEIINDGLLKALNQRFTINPLRQAVIKYVFTPNYTNDIISKIDTLVLYNNCGFENANVLVVCLDNLVASKMHDNAKDIGEELQAKHQVKVDISGTATVDPSTGKISPGIRTTVSYSCEY